MLGTLSPSQWLVRLTMAETCVERSKRYPPLGDQQRMDAIPTMDLSWPLVAQCSKRRHLPHHSKTHREGRPPAAENGLRVSSEAPLLGSRGSFDRSSMDSVPSQSPFESSLSVFSQPWGCGWARSGCGGSDAAFRTPGVRVTALLLLEKPRRRAQAWPLTPIGACDLTHME